MVKEINLPSVKEFEGWLTTSEAARELGRTRQGIHWMIDKEHLLVAARTKLGILIDPKSVEALKRNEGTNR